MTNRASSTKPSAFSENPNLGWVFQEALMEVPITADLGNDRIFGLVDRLIVSDKEVIAIDYKSNRMVPKTEAETPMGLVRQMAAYQHALGEIYPNHRIRSLLLWTKTGTVTELSDQRLNEALEAVTTT